jgi:hypothetical protein
MIKRFHNFYEDNLLNESLNTPVEFYLTDDTRLPVRIYGAFTIDEDTYGMSLEKSDHDGIYLLKMYRVLAKKPRKWSFRKPSHVRPALSTLLKFVEASIPFIKPHMKAIICQVSGQGVERYIRFAERVIKKSYITSFKILPTTKSPDKKMYPWENIFIARIGVSPKAVFSDSKFKAYDFPDGVLTHETAIEIKPKIRELLTVKTEPSKKYKFGSFEVDEINIDSEVFDMITKIEKEHISPVADNTPKADASFDSEGLSDENKETLKLYATVGQKKKIANLFSMVNKDPSLVLSALIQTYKETNPNEVIMEVGDVQFVLDQMFKSGSFNGLRSYLADLGIISLSHGDLEIGALKGAIDKYKKGLPKKTALKSTMNVITQFEKAYTKKSKHSQKQKKKPSMSSGEVGKKINTFKTNILPEQLIPTLPGVGVFDYNKDRFYEIKTGSNVKKEDTELMVNRLSEELGYDKAIKHHKNFEYVADYTTSSYTYMNNRLRDAFIKFNSKSSADKPSKGQVSNYKEVLNEGSVGKVADVFDELKPLPESLWVYRNTALPLEVQQGLKSGEDFVDPAIMSTSIRSTLDFSSSDGHRFRIFLPKGSRVIPILNLSKHKDENEIILPPFSVLKIIRIDEFNSHSIYDPEYRSYLITCVFVGSVFKNFREQFNTWAKSFLNESSEKSSIRSAKKQNVKAEYNPKDKFGNGTDAETLKAAAAFAKSMKFKKK